MNIKRHLLLIFTLFVVMQIKAQDLPDSWNISADGRMLTAGGENNEGFYSQNVIHDVEIEFLQPNWWQLLEDNYDLDIDLVATCWIDGVQFDEVGVSFKGATSYFRNNTEKKSFNINLDYSIDGQGVEGYNTFNLNCGWEDNSSIREVLYNNIGHNYYMGLKSNYVNLTINGEYWGPYQSVQQFDSDYIKEWYLSNNGTIWRAEKIEDDTSGPGGGPGGGGGQGGNFGTGRSTLNYNGPDSTDYDTDYTLKRTEQDDPWAGLIAACDVLNNEPLATLEEELSLVLDIDKTCWFLAHETIFADDDSYINKGGSDYFAYHEAETGRLIPMEYDGNSVLKTTNLEWSLFYNENDTDFPLLNRMLAVPAIRQRYLAHVRVILADYFTSAYADPKIDTWAALIDEHIEADPKKFYTYAQFQDAVVSLKQAIITRRNSLMNNVEMANVESLQVSDVSYAVEGVQWESPDMSQDVDIVATVTGSVGISSVWLYFGEGFTGTFAKVAMYDDGQHNDGSSGDGQFGAAIPAKASGIYVRYYIEAIADDTARTATYEPKGAEHDVFLYQVQLEMGSDTPVVINELMPDNEAATADSFGEFDDWLELYNTSDTTVDLTGWTLTDDINELDKYTIPSGTLLEPNGYLVIWADDDDEQGEFHANFKLSSGGEQLFLLNSEQELVDQVEFPEATTDLAYARSPNGTGVFQYQEHTIAENNEESTELGLSEYELELGFYMHPNPATKYITIEAGLTTTNISNVQILTINGQVIYSNKEEISNSHMIPLDTFNAGVYFISFEIGDTIRTNKFVKM